MKYSVGEQLLAAIFFQIRSGSEEATAASLIKKGHKNLFKGLGSYDLVSLFETQSLEDPLLYQAESRVYSSQAVCAYQMDGVNHSPDSIDNWVKDTPVLGFIFLELDKLLYTPIRGAGSGIEACQSIIEYIQENGGKAFKKDNLQIYGGYGRSEIYALLKADSFDHLWEFIEFLRSIPFGKCFKTYNEDDQKLPVFFRTKTIPLVSYNYIKKKEDSWTVSGIQGSTMATLRVSCSSGFEEYLEDYFSKDEFIIEDTFGDDDIFIKTLKPLSSKAILEKLISFREKWTKKHTAPIRTQTIIHRTYELKKACKPTAYEIENPQIETAVSTELNENNPWLANRILSFMHRLAMVLEDRSNATLIDRMPSYVTYLHKSIIEHSKVVEEKNLAKIHHFESLLLEAIDNAEVGLAQRINSSFDQKQGEALIALPFADGILSSVVSLEMFIGAIFSTWSKEHKKFKDYDYYWSGFAVFSDSVGFRLRWGEVMFLPLGSATRPFSDNGNWLTITHEISHAIYVRLQVAENLKEFFIKVYNTLFLNEEVTNKKFPTFVFFKNEMAELYAHWYDFHHFYNGELYDYLLNIWRSWIKLPVVEENFSEYFLRSFVIFATADLETITEASKQGGDEYRKFIKKVWEEHLNFFEENLDIVLSKYTEKISQEKNDLLVTFQKYATIINCFYRECFDQIFRKKINNKYEKLDQHIQNILEGKIITDNIENPYILTKELARGTHYKDLSSKINTAFILSQKNQKYFLS